MISNHIISYHIISYHIISYCIMFNYIMSYYIIWNDISYHIIIISCHIISYNITSHHIISYNIISYHISSHHIKSGKKEFLGADVLFPLLVAVLVHAELPTVHLILVNLRWKYWIRFFTRTKVAFFFCKKWKKLNDLNKLIYQIIYSDFFFEVLYCLFR